MIRATARSGPNTRAAAAPPGCSSPSLCKGKPEGAIWGGDESPLGIAVLENTLELNGATIKSTATQSPASMGHDGLDHDRNHRVDTDVCHRTAQVRAGLVRATSRTDCAAVTDGDLFGLTSLNLSGAGISDLEGRGLRQAVQPAHPEPELEPD